VALNVGHELGQCEHPIRDIGLKYCTSGKYNSGMDDVGLQEFEELSDDTNMPVVLAYRILELELGSIQHLCPVAVLCARKDPPLGHAQARKSPHAMIFKSFRKSMT
jgi:hypothetical protein